jgi:hypothetical protein
MDIGGAPLEGSGGLQIGGDEAVDGRTQFSHGAEPGSLQRPAGEKTEPDLDLVQPGWAGPEKTDT